MSDSFTTVNSAAARLARDEITHPEVAGLQFPRAREAELARIAAETPEGRAWSQCPPTLKP